MFCFVICWFSLNKPMVSIQYSLFVDGECRGVFTRGFIDNDSNTMANDKVLYLGDYIYMKNLDFLLSYYHCYVKGESVGIT